MTSANLIKQDRALRVDATKLDGLTATEAAAEKIVRAIRVGEEGSVWEAEHEHIEHPFPGMEVLDIEVGDYEDQGVQ